MDHDELPPELIELGASLREEWRAEEEAWTNEAATAWRHARSVADLAREWMQAGDQVEIEVSGLRFCGPIAAVGDDVVGLHAPGGRVDIRVHAATSFRRRRSVEAPGRSPGPEATFSARLLELETNGRRVAVGAGRDELGGTLTVGRDHVTVHADAVEHVVPLAAIAYVRVAQDDF